jgi:hypothetical protein
MRELTRAVTAFERETGLGALCAQAAAGAKEDVMAVYLRAELALSEAKDRHFAALAA